MMWNMRPALADLLDLRPHPEGGWYRQTWASPETVTLPDGRRRSTATLIHFLLPAGESSAWHRVASDEVWLAHSGSVVLELGGDGRAPRSSSQTTALGLDLTGGEVLQVVVPAHVWQRTLPGEGDALVSCLVSPGFDFSDFELATDGEGDGGEGDGGEGDGGEENGTDQDGTDEVEHAAGSGAAADADEVPRAPASPDEAPVEPSEPTNPA